MNKPIGWLFALLALVGCGSRASSVDTDALVAETAVTHADDVERIDGVLRERIADARAIFPSGSEYSTQLGTTVLSVDGIASDIFFSGVVGVDYHGELQEIDRETIRLEPSGEHRVILWFDSPGPCSRDLVEIHHRGDDDFEIATQRESFTGDRVPEWDAMACGSYDSPTHAFFEDRVVKDDHLLAIQFDLEQEEIVFEFESLKTLVLGPEE